MINLILKVFYLMIPVYFANMTPVFTRKINFLNYPVDFNKKFKGKPILGSHKTFRGFFFGILAGIIITYIQFLLQRYPAFASISLFDYSNWIVIGFLLGCGSLIGDSTKSFFKRRANIKPGKPFIPWDQLDYSIGSLLFISFIYLLPWEIIITTLVLNFLLHIVANHLGYYLKIRKVKW